MTSASLDPMPTRQDGQEILGRLRSTPDSIIPDLDLEIRNLRTSWGRLRSNTITFADKSDRRIPRTAFILFWYRREDGLHSSNDVAKIPQQSQRLHRLTVAIWPCATYGICINGKHLGQTEGGGRVTYGHVHSGDIIKVYQNKLERLQFECEFYFGSGRMPRVARTSFQTMVGPKLMQNPAPHTRPQSASRTSPDKNQLVDSRDSILS